MTNATRPTKRGTYKQLLLAFLFAAATLPAFAAESTAPSLIESTDRYEFHSNFWINLHHFLYQQAKRRDGRPMEGGRRLSRDEFATIDGVVDWYRGNLAEHSLLMNERLYAVKRALIAFGPDDVPEHDAVSDDHLQQLLAAAPLYRKYYWSRHDRQNREVVAWHRDRIRSMEHRVFKRIAELAQQEWPDEPVRVDVTWDANWAGAYCTVDPIHAVITSRNGGPENTWPPGGWLELLFHEPSHAVIDPNTSPVGRILNEAALELGRDNAGQLWHAVLFLFSGTAVQEALQQQGVDHQLLMISGDIFSRYQPAVHEHFADYIAGKGDIETAARDALRALASARD